MVLVKRITTASRASPSERLKAMVRLLLFTCDLQRQVSVDVDDVCVGSAADEQVHDAPVVAGCCGVERGPPVVINGVHVGSLGNQKLCDLEA